jgi:hypothetical protein
MSSSKKIDLLRDFAAGVYLSEAQNPITLYTLYTYIQYKYSHREGGWGGLEPERRLVGNSSQSWVESASMTDCLTKTMMNTCRKVPLQVIF